MRLYHITHFWLVWSSLGLMPRGISCCPPHQVSWACDQAAGGAVLQPGAETIVVFLLSLEGKKEQKVVAVSPKLSTLCLVLIFPTYIRSLNRASTLLIAKVRSDGIWMEGHCIVICTFITWLKASTPPISCHQHLQLNLLYGEYCLLSSIPLCDTATTIFSLDSSIVQLYEEQF